MDIESTFKNLLKNLANVVTFLGLYGTICNLIIVIFFPEELIFMASMALFVVFTDWLDGKIARLLRTTSNFGAVLDQLRDKIFVVPIIIILTWRHHQIAGHLSIRAMVFMFGLIGLLLFVEVILFIAWWIFLISGKTQIKSHRWAKRKTAGEFVIIITWLISLIIEIELEKPIIDSSIYLISIMLIITNVFAYIALQTYYREYIKSSA